MGRVIRYSKQVDLGLMVNNESRSGSGYCLVNTTVGAGECIVLATGATVTVDLSGHSNQFTVEAFEVNTRVTAAHANVNDGAVRTLTNPSSVTTGVIFLLKETNTGNSATRGR